MLPSSLGRLARICTNSQALASRRVPAIRLMMVKAARAQNARRRLVLTRFVMKVFIELSLQRAVESVAFRTKPRGTIAQTWFLAPEVTALSLLVTWARQLEATGRRSV